MVAGFQPPNTNTLEELTVRLALAAAMGMIVGLEREVRDKPAGIRTHTLVSIAAASFTILTFELLDTVLSRIEHVNADPIRIIEAVISGVAFLGAGAIIQTRGNIEGITTGASIWLTGAIGLACGAGHYVLGAIAVGIALVVLEFLGFIVRVVRDAAGKSEPTEHEPDIRT